MDVAVIEKEALLLPDSQRALLADRLLESLAQTSSELRTAWVNEIDSRMEAFRSGELSALDGPQAMAKLRAQFNK